MSLLAELYLCADDQQAVKYDTEPETFRDREQFTSFTDLELSTLWAKMRGIDWDVNLLDEFRPIVLVEDDGARTIHRLPVAMTAELAALTPEQVSSSAAKWATTDELACEPSEVQPIIEGLVRLARNASETKRNLYLWNCV
jgi:hypothetical protein